MAQKIKVTVLTGFTLAGQSFAPGEAELPTGLAQKAIDRLVEKKLINAPVSGVATAGSDAAANDAGQPEIEALRSQLEDVTKERDELREKLQILEAKTDDAPNENSEVKDEFSIFTGIDRRALNSLKAAGIDTRQKIVETDNATLEKLQYVTQQNIEQMRGQIAAAVKPGA